MKGVLILSERRSGSTWLTSLTNSVGTLGVCGEWIDQRFPDVDVKTASAEAYARAVIARGTGPNGFFAIKIFPWHLAWFRMRFGCDFVDLARGWHDLDYVILTRRDRIRQAISFSRATQTNQWSSKRAPDDGAEAVYDFGQILRCLFLIDRSLAFWDGYTELRGLTPGRFVYEDMLASPRPFVERVAAHAGVTELPEFATDLKVQRDAVTEDWHARFLAEAAQGDILAEALMARPKNRTLSNLGRFLRGAEMKPYSFYPG